MPCLVSSPDPEIRESSQGAIAEHLTATGRALEYLDRWVRHLEFEEFQGLEHGPPALREHVTGIVAGFLEDSEHAGVLPPEVVGRRIREVVQEIGDERAASRLADMACESASQAYYPPLVEPGQDFKAYNRAALRRQNREIRAFVKSAVKQINRWAASRDKTPGRRLLMSGAQGSGKTTVAGKAAVRMLRRGMVLWLTEPTTKKVAEEVEKLKAYAARLGIEINIIGIYGYSARVPGSADPAETMCRRGKIASAMAKAGFSVKQSMCLGCPFAETCHMKKMLAEIEEAKTNGLPTIYVLAHEYQMLPFCPAPRPNILVADEDFELAASGKFDADAIRRMLGTGPAPVDPAGAIAEIDAAVQATDPVAALATIGWPAILTHLRVIRLALGGPASKPLFDQVIQAVRKAPPETKVPRGTAATMRSILRGVTAGEAVAFFDEIVDALNGPAPMHQLLSQGQDALVARCKAAVRHINVIEALQSITAGRGMTDQECEQLLSRVPDRSAFRSKWLFKQIIREVEAGCAAGRGTFNSVLMREGVEVFWLKPLNIAGRIPVLALDGTGIFERHYAKWGARLEQQHIRLERWAEVIQCPEGFSKQSLLGHLKNGKPHYPEKAKVRREKLNKLILVEGGGNPDRAFFAATKKVEELMVEEQGIDQICKTGHFGALRGINAFEQCEVVIVAGREQIGPRDAEDAARAYLATDPRPIIQVESYKKETRNLRMRDGSVRPVEVDVHPDERIQRISVESVREAELAQTIDRSRPIFNERKIVILSSVVLDITVDRIADNLDDLIAGGSRIELAVKQLGGRVLPLVPAEHVRLGLAKTIDQAKGVLDRRADDDHVRQAIPGWYLSVVEYRPVGGAGRGPRPRAAVGSEPGMDVRQLLEAAVGPVEDGYEILENLRLAA